MPLALVSDIHGNDTALAAVVEELDRIGVDGVVCLGDVVQGGPQPVEVLDRLAELGWPVVRGNSDVEMLDTGGEVERWSCAQLEPRHLEQIRAFRATVAAQADGRSLLGFHGSPASYDDVLLPSTPDAEVERLLGGSGADLLAGGHVHLQWTRRVGDALFVNPGSVGAPRHPRTREFAFAPYAEFAVVTRSAVDFRRVAYDPEPFFAASEARAWPHRAADRSLWQNAY